MVKVGFDSSSRGRSGRSHLGASTRCSCTFFFFLPRDDAQIGIPRKNVCGASKSTPKLTNATSPSQQFTIDDMRRQMDKVKNIRNMSVIAHVDHVSR